MFMLRTSFILFICIYQTLTTDYCSLLCQNQNASHTLCKYPNGQSKSCADYKKIEFTPELKKYVVDIHNDIRDHVASGKETKGVLGGQPSASNMNVLIWDNELAEIAQRWANQCIALENPIQHDTCRKTDRFDVGQNILTAVTRTVDFPDMGILILNWYKQVEHVIPSDLTNFSGSTRGKLIIGQYTQLVWAESKYIGCGAATFSKSSKKKEFLHRLVCNYGPRGNLVGSSVYKKGLPCETCPGKCDSVRKHLCRGDINSSFTNGFLKSATNKFITNHILKEKNTKMLKTLLNSATLINIGSCTIEDQSKNNLKPAISTLKYYSQPSKIANKIYFHIPREKMEFKQSDLYDDLQCGAFNWTTTDEEITLPSGTILKRENGTWKNGKCRCHFVYRSSGTKIYSFTISYLWIFCFSLLRIINFCNKK